MDKFGFCWMPSFKILLWQFLVAGDEGAVDTAALLVDLLSNEPQVVVVCRAPVPPFTSSPSGRKGGVRMHYSLKAEQQPITKCIGLVATGGLL